MVAVGVSIGGVLAFRRGSDDPQPAAQPTGSATSPSTGSASVDMTAIRITTVPQGAIVRIDGQPHGASPVDVRIARGTRIAIVAEHAGFVAASQTIIAGEGPQEVSLPLAPMPVASAIDAGTPDASIAATAPAGAATKTTKTTKATKHGAADSRTRGSASTTSGSASYNPNEVGGD